MAIELSLTFGQWLQQRRKALSLTREQLASRVGCSISALRKIEAGERRPSEQIAELLANNLELAPAARPVFVRVARGEQTLERLPPPGLAREPRRGEQPPAPSAPRHNLPVHATPLVGRQAELAELGRLLADPGCRLITLAGPGGVGKTRLAVRAARLFGEAFGDGAAFVALAPLSSAGFLITAVAEAIGLSFSGPDEPQAQLLAFLRDKEILLVLDNAEHLLGQGTAELLAALLQAAPALKLLVTTRETLKLQVEWVFAVQGLPVGGRAGEAQPAEGDAAKLFLQRAQRAQVGFVPRAGDEQAIVRICQLVDGLPLAIELAAAWVRTLSCAEIAQEIEANPAVLSISAADVPERHRSLQSVFEHSWALLSASEQSALRRLSVFRGGFTRQAAEHVAGATLAALSALVSKSLVRRAGAGRYDLHELIRQYARERLRQAEAEDLTREALADWMLDFALSAQRQMYTPDASAALNAIEREHHNARAVLEWALEPAAGVSAANRVAIGLRLMCALFEFLFVRGHHHEALTFFQRLLARPEALSAMQARTEALTQAAYFYYLQYRHCEARAAVEEALVHSRALGDRKQLARGLEHRGLVAIAEGDLAAARADLEQSLAIWRELKAGFQEVELLSHLGDIALMQHDYDRAEQLYTQALNPGGSMPAGVQHPYPPRRLAHLVLRRGERGWAIELAHQSLRLNLAIKDARAMAACMVALASVARAQEDLVRAARLSGAVEGILASIFASLVPADREAHERNVEALKEHLMEPDLAAAWAEGRALSLEQAVDYALQAK